MDPVSKAQIETVEHPHAELISKGISGRWKPGQSGNPAGRPKKEARITKMCEEIMDEAREAIKAQIIKTVTSKGMAGVLMFRELAERVEGKVTQNIDLTGSVNTMTDQELMERMAKLLTP